MANPKVPIQYRQGDVFFVKVDELPKAAIAQKKEGGRIVIEWGEVTGHAHAVPVDDATLYVEGARRFLEVCYKAELTHEEHAKIEFPAGVYEIVRQREYHPEEIKYVVD